MNDRQRDIVDAAVETVLAMPGARGLDRDHVSAALYQLVIDCAQPPRLTVPEMFRRSPAAGELLPPHQRASWCRGAVI